MHTFMQTKIIIKLADNREYKQDEYGIILKGLSTPIKQC